MRRVRRCARQESYAVEAVNDDLQPLVAPDPNGHPGFSIAQGPFERWWNALHPDDGRAFLELGGDETLAKFVFAYEYLTTQRSVAPLTAKTDAFAAASGLSSYDASLPGRSETAWNHPAVLELIGIFHERNEREIARRIRMRYAHLIEDITAQATATEVGIEEKVRAADTVVKYLKLVSGEEQADRKVREKRAGGKRAQRDVTPGAVPDNARLAGFVRMMKEKYPDQLAALTAQERADENGIIE